MKRFAILGTLGVAAALAAPVSADDLRISHVTIVSPERVSPLNDADVIIHDGRIATISRASGAASSIRTVDGRGLYLAPGLIDSHVHLGSVPGMDEGQEKKHPDIVKAVAAQTPKSFLLYGFTTLVDLVSTPKEMARWRAQPIVPDTYFCGGAPLMDGYPLNYAPKPARYTMAPYMLIEPGTVPPPGIDPAQHSPKAVVTRMKADGAQCVKTFYETGFGPAKNLPVPKLETVRALVQAAHAQGLPVLMHANGAEAQKFGLGAGVDIMAHGIWRGFKDLPEDAQAAAIKKLLDGVIAKQVGWQATIQVLYGERDLFHAGYLSDPALARVYPPSLLAWYRNPESRWFHDALAANMPKGSGPKATQASVDKVYAGPISRVTNAARYLAAHGGRLLFGTDTPSAPTYANPPGLNGWLEIKNLAAAGVTPAQIFKAATLANAQALKLDDDVGTVEVGKRANLLLLRADPTKTIQAYQGIVKVFLGGRVLDPADLVANRVH
jgi:imidazolonepropionase-like amidohydrolase